MKIKKAVITAAGLGTRLLPATKETPKEMLPLFVKSGNNQIHVKPLLQIVFEQMYDFGLRDFCFIVGRGKRSIEDHFIPDPHFIRELNDREKSEFADDLERFYSMLRESDITWKNQLSPKGFGDAVLHSENFVGKEPFLMHAGDTFIISKGNNFFNRLVDAYEKNKAEVTLLCEKVEDPHRYGVIIGKETEKGVYRVQRMVEKPKRPLSNLVSVAVYLFDPVIFKALRETPYRSGEKELTDAIQKLIEKGKKVYAVELKPDEERLDIGKTDTYKSALDRSYSWAARQ